MVFPICFERCYKLLVYYLLRLILCDDRRIRSTLFAWSTGSCHILWSWLDFNVHFGKFWHIFQTHVLNFNKVCSSVSHIKILLFMHIPDFTRLHEFNDKWNVQLQAILIFAWQAWPIPKPILSWTSAEFNWVLCMLTGSLWWWKWRYYSWRSSLVTIPSILKIKLSFLYFWTKKRNLCAKAFKFSTIKSQLHTMLALWKKEMLGHNQLNAPF